MVWGWPYVTGYYAIKEYDWLTCTQKTTKVDMQSLVRWSVSELIHWSYEIPTPYKIWVGRVVPLPVAIPRHIGEFGTSDN